MLLIFVDTETTGLNPEKHRTLEIAYKVLEAHNKKVLISYEAIVSQPAEIWAEADPDSLKINGFSWEQTLQGKSEKVVGSEMINDLNHLGLGQKEGAFVCQNPSFDRAFFNQMISVELQTHNGWPYHWLDLASMYWALQCSEDPHFPQNAQEKDLSKDTIAKRYGLAAEGFPHRAMHGVNHLIECYKAIFNKSARS